MCAQVRRRLPVEGGGVGHRNMTINLPLPKPPLPPMGTSPDGGDSSAEEGARGRASEAPAARPRGATAGDEAICVSSASDGDTRGGGGRFIIGARPCQGVGGSKPPPVWGTPWKGSRPPVAPAGCTRRPRPTRAPVGVAAGRAGRGRAGGGVVGRVRRELGARLLGGGGGPNRPRLAGAGSVPGGVGAGGIVAGSKT